MPNSSLYIMFKKIYEILYKINLYIKAYKIIIKEEVNKLAADKDPALIIRALQKKGVDIADDTILFGGQSIQIDLTRPSLIHIGSKTFLHNGFKLLTHDYATLVFINKYSEFISSSGRVWIGDNVWFGENVTVLKGSHIGDNCIIGINSVVMGEIPARSVAAGCPAEVICSIDENFEKRKNKSIEEAFEYARSIKERFGRNPRPIDFWEEFPLFVSGDEVDKYPEIPIKKQLGPAYDVWVKNHRAKFKSFEDFLKAAGL